MRAYEIQNGFGLENLVMAERPMPVPGPGEALVKIRAVSLNARDIGVINGYYFPELKEPFIPVSDGVGEIVALGDGATRFQVGDRVSGNFSQQWISGEPMKEFSSSVLGAPLDGMLTEYAVLRESGLVRVPDHLTDEEAAALPCAGVTAWHAVVTEGKVKAGDTVVVQGTGGVALFALQFAKLHGARVIVLSGSDEKLDRAGKLGADYGINYRTTPDWEKAVLEWTNRRGADHIVDLGGASTLNRSIAAVRFGGQISLIGLLSGASVEGFNLVPAFQKKVRLQGINVGSREMFEAMNRAISTSKLRPVIDRVFPFEQSVDALKYLSEGAHFGKICIKL